MKQLIWKNRIVKLTEKIAELKDKQLKLMESQVIS